MDIEKSPTSKQLRRTGQGRMIAGVCSGAARYLGVDANIIRLGLVAFSVFGGAGILIYAVAWVLIPEEGAPSSIAEDLVQKGKENPKIQEVFQDVSQKTKNAMNKTHTPK